MDCRSILVTALSLVSLAGCGGLATPHQAYAPLLHRRDQVDIDVRAGVQDPGFLTAAAHVAYAPTDGLEVVAGVDAAAGDPYHIGGMVGVGTFVPHDVLRLEAIAGLAAGVAGTDLMVRGHLFRDSDHQAIVEGAYAMPYGQVLLGFEVTHFELAAGFRLHGYLAETHLVSAVMPDPQLEVDDAHSRLYFEPIVTVRIPFRIVRLDLIAGVPLVIAGDRDLHGVAYDDADQFYIAAGAGFFFDVGPGGVEVDDRAVDD